MKKTIVKIRNTWTGATEEQKYVLKEDIFDIKKLKWVESIDLCKSLIVYDESKLVPVKFLKKFFKDHVLSIEKADVVIMKRSELKQMELYIEDLYLTKSGRYTVDDTSRNLVKPHKVIHAAPCGYPNTEMTIIDKLESNQTKLFIDPISIPIGSEELTDEMAKKIESLLASDDEGMTNLGLRLLLNIDIKKNLNRIVAVLNVVPNTRNKDVRFFLSNLRSLYETFENKGFEEWFPLAAENSDDPVILRNFNKFLGNHMGGYNFDNSHEDEDKSDYMYKLIKIPRNDT